MNLDNDFELAKLIGQKLQGKFWQVTVGEWWVVVEGVSSLRLVVLTNDPFGIAFSSKDVNLAIENVQKQVVSCLKAEGVIHEDGSWATALAS